jgi:antitoxin CptB
MTPGEQDDLAVRRKRARFRAWHRGTRELDLIMGRFADREIDGLDSDDLDRFERLMDEAEGDLYAWVTGQAQPPVEFDTPLLRRLRGPAIA